MSRPSPARLAALRALVRVETDRAYAPLALAGALTQARLERRDRALATELVYGVLRWRGRIDYCLERISTRPLSKLSPWVRGALRLAAYQLLFLDSVPVPVTCSETVLLVKEKEPWAAPFANGVCRSLARNFRELAFPDPQSDPVSYLATVHSHPQWLVKRWHARWGFERALAVCESDNRPAPVTVRVNLARTDVEDLTARLKAHGVDVEPGRLSPAALRLSGAGPVENLPGFAEGLFQVQDESSQLVAWAVAPRPGTRVVDLCAGPGGKSTHIAELLAMKSWEGAKGEPPVLCVDVHPHKSGLVEENARRLGLEGWIRTAVRDAREMAHEYEGRFDRVLVDAPCSGTGVLRRRPDLRWQRKEEELGELVALQRELLEAAARMVAPGGLLIYSTCSLEDEENRENAKWFLEAFPRFQAEPPADSLPEPARSSLEAKGPWVEIFPDQFESDGFFIFRARRTS